MNVLGLDTSTAVSSACVLRADGEQYEEGPAVAPGAEERRGAESRADEGRATAARGAVARAGHARDLLPAIDRALARAELAYADLDAVATGAGPGGFTGLRIGLATAQGIAHAHGLELRRVSSLAALALGAEPLAAGDERVDSVLALIDARRGELFAALYAGGRERLAPFAAPPEEVAQRVAATGLSPLAVGDGSVGFRELLETAGIAVADPGSVAHLVRAASICRLARGTPPEPPAVVLPDYQRLPDAKPR